MTLATSNPNHADDEDAAAVIAILTLLNSGTTSEPAAPVSAWGNPAFALGSPNSWWAAGLPQSPGYR